MPPTENPTPPPPPPARPIWTQPQVECLESRPEVTAYSGDSGTWPLNR